MSKTIYYQHRDCYLYEVELLEGYTVDKDQVYYVEKSTKYLKKRYTSYDKFYNYSGLTVMQTDNKLYLKLCMKGSNHPIYVDAESFYNQVELKGQDYITISSISEYIDCITRYSVVSLFTNCEAVLSKYMEKLVLLLNDDDDTNNNEIKEQYNKLQELKSDAEAKKKLILNTIQSQLNHDELDNIVKAFETTFKEKDINNEASYDSETSYKPTADPYPRIRIAGEAYRAVKHLITRYYGYDYLMYYRGVGHIVYPEMPGVFRENKKFEEDRQYKSMIMAFPKEFNGLRYLDRLAKLQHFELSTRLLDVSSNPLVALYMVCNTIYTNDPKQEDWGEVLIYFTAGEKERAYDSKSILINAALVKIPYSVKTIMYQFIRIHEVSFDKLCNEILNESKKKNKDNISIIDKRVAVIRQKLVQVLNRCVHLACDYDGVDAVLPSNEASTLRQLIQDIQQEIQLSFKAILPVQTKSKDYLADDFCPYINEAKTASDFCWNCMKFVKWPKNGRNWRGIGTDINKVFVDNIDEESYRWMFKQFVMAYDDLLIAIRRENSAFENKINIFNLLRCFHGNIGMTNERILAQSGSFIISGLDNMYLNNNMLSTRSDGYARIIIKNKKLLTEQLSLMNITDATMLPDLTHKAHYITEQIKEKKNQ